MYHIYIGVWGYGHYPLLRSGYYAHGVLDVGANNGQWSLDLKAFLDGHLQHNGSTIFFLMEGNEAHLDSLKNTGFPFHVGLLADDEKDVKYYKVANVSEDMNTVNSMFKEAGWSEELGVTAQASTVDKIVEGAGAGTFN